MRRVDIGNISREILIKKKIQRNSTTNKQNKNFEEIFNQVKRNNDKLKFSKHALQRMENRNISLNSEQISKIENAVKKAENKGVKEALIIMGDTAFVASINNRTIITTATQEQLKENVFTNIDGAVII